MIKIRKEAFETLLKEENISSSKLALNLGVSRSQMWRILNNKCNPGEEFIAKFKNAYPKKSFEEYFFAEGVA